MPGHPRRLTVHCDEGTTQPRAQRARIVPERPSRAGGGHVVTARTQRTSRPQSGAALASRWRHSGHLPDGGRCLSGGPSVVTAGCACGAGGHCPRARWIPPHAGERGQDLPYAFVHIPAEPGVLALPGLGLGYARCRPARRRRSMSSRRRRGCLPRTPSGGCRCRSEPPGRRRRLCGRRQQLIVAGTERARIHLVLLVQAETEEQPRTCTGSCRRRNPSSSSATSPPTCTGAVSLPRSRRRRLLLRVDHQLAELVRRQLARGALLEHRPLEQEPAGDVDRHAAARRARPR